MDDRINFLEKAINQIIEYSSRNEDLIDNTIKYQSNFTDGEEKAITVLNWLNDLKNNFSNNQLNGKIAYVSIGGANGAELLEAMRHEIIEKGILLEYDDNACNVAQKNLTNLKKEFRIFRGDAWANRNECNKTLLNWLKIGEINTVLLAAHSVLHELDFRSDKSSPTSRFKHEEFLSALLNNIPNYLIYIKEPSRIDTIRWINRVKVSCKTTIHPNTFKKFAQYLQKLYGQFFLSSPQIDIVADGVFLDAQLAGETIKKILYLLRDKEVSNALYEVGECHSAFDRDVYARMLNNFFPNDGYSQFLVESSMSTTLKRLWQQSGIIVYGADGFPLQIPLMFTQFSGWRFSEKLSTNDENIILKDFEKIQRSKHEISTSAKVNVERFYSLISVKEYEKAWDFLSKSYQMAKWQGELNRFVEGFSNTSQITDLTVSPISENEFTCKYLVFYRDTAKRSKVPDLEGIERYKLDQIELLLTKIKTYKQKLIELGGNENKISTIPLVRLLSPEGREYSWWHAGVNTKEFKKAFPVEINETLARTLLITCSPEGETWKISKIHPIRNTDPILNE